MQACMYLALGPTSFDGGGGGGGGSSKPVAPSSWLRLGALSSRRRHLVSASAAAGGQRNHYAVLGVPQSASPSQIKRAYRLLALKYHPDVNKEAGADEAFKSIRLAYDTLINEKTRSEYDQALQHPHTTTRPLGDDWVVDREYEERLRFYRWAYARHKMDYKRYWGQNHTAEEQFSFDDDSDISDGENQDEEEDRESFIEVLKSAFISMFLMHTVGIRLSLTFSSLVAMVDPKLDSGYKLGYLLAWILGGRAGILLTMFLSFASWVCGKTSSSIVALVVIAMWFGSNLARYAPLPQGALLTLLYMSIKLQVDLI